MNEAIRMMKARQDFLRSLQVQNPERFLAAMRIAAASSLRIDDAWEALGGKLTEQQIMDILRQHPSDSQARLMSLIEKAAS